MTTRSRILVGTSPKANGETFVAYAERDDAQRLAVLIASHVSKVATEGSEARLQAKRCLEPRATWKQRVALLREALDALPDLDHFATIWDVDALIPSGREDFNDDRTQTQRAQLLKALAPSIDRGGWVLVRTNPKPSSPDLASLDVDLEIDDETALPAEYEPFAPECRGIAQWLVRIEALRPADLAEIVRTVKDFNTHIVRLAIDVLPRHIRESLALAASVLRAPQHVNGAFGPLAWGDAGKQPTAQTIPKNAFTVLADGGFLQKVDSEGHWRFVRSVRSEAKVVSRLVVEESVRSLERRLATEVGIASPLEAKLEAHFYAVRLGDVELATKTASAYGSELRELAIQLSREEHRHLEAAHLFEHIVTRFDETDAYAWEYLGFNLALVEDPNAYPKVLHAYQQAHKHWPENPLYHGRLLGFRAQIGDNVDSDIVRSIGHYVQAYGDEREGVSHFAQTAIMGLVRANQTERARSIITKCRGWLERFAPRALADLNSRVP